MNFVFVSLMLMKLWNVIAHWMCRKNKVCVKASRICMAFRYGQKYETENHQWKSKTHKSKATTRESKAKTRESKAKTHKSKAKTRESKSKTRKSKSKTHKLKSNYGINRKEAEIAWPFKIRDHDLQQQHKNTSLLISIYHDCISTAALLHKRHLPWGLPEGGAGDGGCILTQQGFVTGYSTNLRIPLWVAYHLTGEVRIWRCHKIHQENMRTSWILLDPLIGFSCVHQAQGTAKENSRSTT